MPNRRATASLRSGARPCLIGGLLPLLALLALPISLDLSLHHADHHGAWVAAEPASHGVERDAPGREVERACPVCLASGQAGSGVAPQASGPLVDFGSADRPARRTPLALPSPADLSAAAPRAPPNA